MRSPLLVAVFALGACSIGTPGMPVLPIDAPPPIDAYHCDNAVTPGLAGPAAGDTELGSAHRAGEDCMACHATGVESAPIFTIAGTLYIDPTGTTPVAGATIFVHDANGVEVRMPTASNGNFYSTQNVALPLQGTELNGSKATQCPNTRTMQESTTGGCNKSACHEDPNAASGTPVGRIYL